MKLNVSLLVLLLLCLPCGVTAQQQYALPSLSSTSQLPQISGNSVLCNSTSVLGTPSGCTTIPTSSLPAFSGDCTTPGGSGVLTCTKTNGASFSPVATSGSASDLSTGTLAAARLPNPSASTLGGVESYASVSHQWINGISTSGVPSSTQPAASDITGLAAIATAQTASQIQAIANSPSIVDVTNATYAADPTGVTDAAAAINAALAANNPNGSGQVASVHLPSGTYYIKSKLVLHTGQCLYGDGALSTTIKVDQSFSTTDTGVVVTVNGPPNNACLHDLSILGAQPQGGTTTTTAAQASGTTITVASAANISIGNIVYDLTTTTAIPANTTVTNIAGTTLTLSATATGVLSGDSIAVNPGRSNFVALGACTSGTGGTGCQYPPFIYNRGSPGIRMWNVHIEGAWTGIDTTGDVHPQFTNLEVGALNAGWIADGATDFVLVKGWETWEWGFAGTSSSNAWHDGSTIAWQIGRMDGLNVSNAGFFDSRIVITSNASNSLTPSQYTNVMMDGNNSNLEISGGYANLFNNFYKTGSSSTATCSINVTGGSTQIDNALIAVGGSSNYVCVSGGSIKFVGGQTTESGGSISAYAQSAGLLDIEGMYFNMPATISTAAIAQTGGSIVLKNNYAHVGTSGTAVSISADSNGSVVQGNNFQQYAYSFPTGAVNGFYSASVQTQFPSIDASSISFGPTTLTGFPTSAVTLKATAVGVGALNGTMTSAATNDTAIGNNACGAVTTATANTCVGTSAGGLTTTGGQNVYVGSAAGANATSAANNVLVGHNVANSGSSLTFAGVTGIGQNALHVVQGNGNTAIGINSCDKITSGTNNVCLGQNVGATTLATGSSNILIGSGTGIDTVASSTSNEINVGGLLFLNNNSTAAPVVSACGTSPSIDAHANNRSGTVTVGSGTVSSCTVTFAGTGYNTWNHCRVTPDTASVAAFGYSYTKTVLTVTATSLTSDVFDYDCDGY